MASISSKSFSQLSYMSTDKYVVPMAALKRLVRQRQILTEFEQQQNHHSKIKLCASHTIVGGAGMACGSGKTHNGNNEDPKGNCQRFFFFFFFWRGGGGDHYAADQGKDDNYAACGERGEGKDIADVDDDDGECSGNFTTPSWLAGVHCTFPSSWRHGGRGSSAVERATPGEEVPGSIPAVAARSLQAGSVSV